jgi:hypothetical protein
MDKNNLPAIEVCKNYLTAELSKIFQEGNFKEGLINSINKLSERDLWRLLEAISFTYRLNGVFEIVSNTSFAWKEKEVDCKDLILTGMNPSINKIINSERIKNDPIKFRDYLLSYFKEHPHDDPENLDQFRPNAKPIEYPTILLIQDEDKLKLLDGSNRLMAHLINGGTKMNAIIGKSVVNGKRRIGDSTFLLLRMAYETSGDKEKQAIYTTTKRLIELSSDGHKAIQAYWIDHTEDETLKKIGKSLLSEIIH